MDYIVNHWQDITALAIVGATIFIMIRSAVQRSKKASECSTCALAEVQRRQGNFIR